MIPFLKIPPEVGRQIWLQNLIKQRRVHHYQDHPALLKARMDLQRNALYQRLGFRMGLLPPDKRVVPIIHLRKKDT